MLRLEHVCVRWSLSVCVVCVCERERVRERGRERARHGVQLRVCEVNTFGIRVEKGVV